MNVIKVSIEIFFVTNRVFPETRLPDSSPTFPTTSLRNNSFVGTRTQPTRSEFLLNPADSGRVFSVTRRQAEDCVQVIRQQNDRCERKRSLTDAFTNDVAE